MGSLRKAYSAILNFIYYALINMFFVFLEVLFTKIIFNNNSLHGGSTWLIVFQKFMHFDYEHNPYFRQYLMGRIKNSTYV
jgi:hypothetical protein